MCRKLWFFDGLVLFSTAGDIDMLILCGVDNDGVTISTRNTGMIWLEDNIARDGKYNLCEAVARYCVCPYRWQRIFVQGNVTVNGYVHRVS